jgi:hypothetical protein
MTPMLPGLIRTIFFFGLSDPMASTGVIIEMQPLYQGAFGKVLLILMVALLMIMLRSRRQQTIVDWLILACVAVAAIRHGRFAVLLALCALPAVTLSATDLSDRLLSRIALVRTLYGLLALGTVTLFLLMPSANQPMEQWANRRGPQQAGFPFAAAEFVARSVPATHGRLINEFSWGGYLGWRLGERFKVLMDGRTPVYTDELWTGTYLGTDNQRHDYLARIQADAAVLPRYGSLFQDTLLQLGWREVYADERARVLMPPSVSVPLFSSRLTRSYRGNTYSDAGAAQVCASSQSRSNPGPRSTATSFAALVDLPNSPGEVSHNPALIYGGEGGMAYASWVGKRLEERVTFYAIYALALIQPNALAWRAPFNATTIRFAVIAMWHAR